MSPVVLSEEERAIQLKSLREIAETYEVIGLTGPKGIGKSTLANSLIHPGGKVLSFAKPIKDMLRAAGVPKEYLYRSKEAQVPGFPDGITGRILCQSLGTEWGRNQIDESLWVTVARNRVDWDTELEFCNPIIFDDLRFPNEAEWIRSREGEVWQIIREGYTSEDSHISEAGIPEELINRHITIHDIPELDE